MCHHDIQSLHCHWLRYGLVALVLLRVQYIRVRIPGNKELHTSEVLTNGYHEVLQGGGIVQWEVATKNLPVLTSLHQIKYDEVRAMLRVCLHREAPRLSFKEHNAPTVLDCCIRCHHTKPHQRLYIDAAIDL